MVLLYCRKLRRGFQWQEEVENRSVNLAVQTGKVTLQTILKGLKKAYDHHQNKKLTKETDTAVKGEQTVKELIGQEIQTTQKCGEQLRVKTRFSGDWGRSHRQANRVRYIPTPCLRKTNLSK